MSIQPNINSDINKFIDNFKKELPVVPSKITKETLQEVFNKKPELETLYHDLSNRKVEIQTLSYEKGTIQHKIVKLLLKEPDTSNDDSYTIFAQILAYVQTLIQQDDLEGIKALFSEYDEIQLNTIFRAPTDPDDLFSYDILTKLGTEGKTEILKYVLENLEDKTFYEDINLLMFTLAPVHLFLCSQQTGSIETIKLVLEHYKLNSKDFPNVLREACDPNNGSVLPMLGKDGKYEILEYIFEVYKEKDDNFNNLDFLGATISGGHTETINLVFEKYRSHHKDLSILLKTDDGHSKIFQSAIESGRVDVIKQTLDCLTPDERRIVLSKETMSLYSYYENTELLKYVLESLEDKSIYNTPDLLCSSIKSGNIDTINFVIAQYRANLPSLIPLLSQARPLAIAIDSKRADVVKALIMNFNTEEKKFELNSPSILSTIHYTFYFEENNSERIEIIKSIFSEMSVEFIHSNLVYDETYINIVLPLLEREQLKNLLLYQPPLENDDPPLLKIILKKNLDLPPLDLFGENEYPLFELCTQIGNDGNTLLYNALYSDRKDRSERFLALLALIPPNELKNVLLNNLKLFSRVDGKSMDFILDKFNKEDQFDILDEISNDQFLSRILTRVTDVVESIIKHVPAEKRVEYINKSNYIGTLFSRSHDSIYDQELLKSIYNVNCILLTQTKIFT